MMSEDGGCKLLCLLLLLAVGLGTPGLVVACPTDCNCKWKGGKQTVECVGKGLRTFPAPIDAGTQVRKIFQPLSCHCLLF